MYNRPGWVILEVFLEWSAVSVIVARPRLPYSVVVVPKRSQSHPRASQGPLNLPEGMKRLNTEESVDLQLTRASRSLTVSLLVNCPHAYRTPNLPQFALDCANNAVCPSYPLFLLAACLSLSKSKVKYPRRTGRTHALLVLCVITASRPAVSKRPVFPIMSANWFCTRSYRPWSYP